MSLNRMPYLDWLRGFVAVGKHLSFRKAAEELCLSQSAVSKQVQALEAFLETKLFIRHPRSIEFTEHGYTLYVSGRQALEQIQSTVEGIEESRRRDIVKVSTSVGFAGLWLLPRLRAFYEEHPGLDLHVSAEDRSIEELSDHGVDLAVRYGHRDSMPGDAALLYKESLVPVVSAGFEARSDDLRELLSHATWLEYRNPKTRWLTWEAWLREFSVGVIEPKRVLYYNQYDQLIHAAMSGQGVALGRLPLVSNFLSQGLLEAIYEGTCPMNDYGYWILSAEPGARNAAKTVAQWMLLQSSDQREEVETAS